MATEINTLQASIRRYARLSNYNATSAEALIAGNNATRVLAGLVPWQELTRSNQTINTVASQEQYPLASVQIFLQITIVEIVDPNDSTRLIPIPKYMNDVTWRLAGKEPDGVPEIHRKEHNGTDNVLSLRPKPLLAGTNNIKITGIIEPTAYTSGSNSTPFHTVTADDILAHMWAASELFKSGENTHANWNMGQAIQSLRALTGVPVNAQDLMKQLQ